MDRGLGLGDKGSAWVDLSCLLLLVSCTNLYHSFALSLHPRNIDVLHRLQPYAIEHFTDRLGLDGLPDLHRLRVRLGFLLRLNHQLLNLNPLMIIITLFVIFIFILISLCVFALGGHLWYQCDRLAIIW